MMLNMTPMNNDTDRAGDTASFILSFASSSELFVEAEYPLAPRPVAARARKEHRYNPWSMHNVAGLNAASPAAPTVRPTNALSMLESSGDVR